jgi:arylsulfatase A-like enzyme
VTKKSVVSRGNTGHLTELRNLFTGFGLLTAMPGKNVILITVDSLRKDHLSCYGYHRKTSPNIDQFAAGATVFPDAFCQGANTPFSFPTILGGIYPLLLDNWLSGQSSSPIYSPSFPLVAEEFKRGGYRTGGFHSNPHISRFFGYARGFDTFYDSISTFTKWDDKFYGESGVKTVQKKRTVLMRRIRKAVERRPTLFRVAIGLKDRIVPFKTPYAMAGKINREAGSFLDSGGGPVFMWLHYMDNHFPYNATPEEFEEFIGKPISAGRIAKLNRKMLHRWLKESDVGDVIDLYDASIWALDRRIGGFLDGLDERGMLEDSIIAFTADHGESFFDHGLIRHPPDNFYDEQMRVPLIIKGLGDIEPAGLVGLIDLAPTLLERAGLPVSDRMMGKTIPHDREEVYCEFNLQDSQKLAIRTARWKYIWTPRTGEAELYDLRDDPGEISDLTGKRPAVEEVLKETLQTHMKQVEGTYVRMKIADRGL